MAMWFYHCVYMVMWFLLYCLYGYMVILVCLYGYVTDIDECTTHPCTDDGGICINIPGDYICLSVAGGTPTGK